MDRRSHYDTLGVSGVGASTEDIKRAYKSLALTLHPDRPGGDADAFVRVSRAWEVLRDADARRAYDSVLLSRRRDVVVSDEIDIEDMDGEEVPSGSDSEGEGGGRRRWHAHTRFAHRCRCGDVYEVTSDELHPDFDDVDVPCASCSLYVRVNYGGAEPRDPPATRRDADEG